MDGEKSCAVLGPVLWPGLELLDFVELWETFNPT